jgi:hypothetical protein
MSGFPSVPSGVGTGSVGRGKSVPVCLDMFLFPNLLPEFELNEAFHVALPRPVIHFVYRVFDQSLGRLRRGNWEADSVGLSMDAWHRQSNCVALLDETCARFNRASPVGTPRLNWSRSSLGLLQPSFLLASPSHLRTYCVFLC